MEDDEYPESFAQGLPGEFTAGLGHAVDSVVWVDGTPLSLDHHPECIDIDSFDCRFCEYFVPRVCPLANELEALEDARTLFRLQRERQARLRARRLALVKAAHSELKAHGRPMHYSLLAEIIRSRYPHLRATDEAVARALDGNPAKFECVDPGVYQHK